MALIRISARLRREDLINLDAIASARGTNRTEVLRGALATEKNLHDFFVQGAELYVKLPGSREYTRLAWAAFLHS